MTPARRRLVALAVTLAPGRAPALLAHLGDGEADPAGALASVLASAPRRTRLAALAAALPACAHAPPGAGHPLLERLRLEAQRDAASTTASTPGATSVPAAGRTLVRPAADPPRPGVSNPP